MSNKEYLRRFGRLDKCLVQETCDYREVRPTSFPLPPKRKNKGRSLACGYVDFSNPATLPEGIMFKNEGYVDLS